MLRHALLAIFVLLTAPALAQEATIPVPAGVEARGVPPIPASLAKEIAKYTGAYGYRLAGWNPEKREIRLKLLSGLPTYFRVESPGAREKIWKQLLVGNVYDLYPDPSARYIIYNKDEDGNEAFQMYLYDVKTYKSKLLSDPGSRNTEFVWSHAGDRVVYCRSKSSEGPGVSLYLMDPRDPSTNRLLLKSDGNYLKAYDWSPDDTKIVYCEFYGQGVDRLWMLDLATGKTTRLSPPGDRGDYYGLPKFNRDGTGIYLLTDRNSDFKRLAFLDIARRRYRFLSHTVRRDVDGFQVSPDGSRIAYTINDAGYSTLYSLDLSRREVREAKGIPEGIISNLTWHRDGNEVAFELRGPRRPCDIYSYDVESETITVWTKSRLGGLAPENIAIPELVRWKSFDKKEIQGFLYRPSSMFTGKRPVIISLHGGPFEQYRPRFDYVHNYYLNELGVAWIYPNYRGSTGYGKGFHHSDDGLKREAVVKDIGALLDWIAAQEGLDASRVLVVGGSYGGYLALSVACAYGAKIKGVATESGLSSLSNFMNEVEISRIALQRGEFGDERVPSIRAFMERTAPINNLAKVTAPVLIIHGKNDPIAPISGALALADRAVRQGLRVWQIWESNEGHSAGTHQNWQFEIYCNVMFAKDSLGLAARTGPE